MSPTPISDHDCLPWQRAVLCIVAVIWLAGLGACGQNKALEHIKKSGVITVITSNNAHCYYTYRDEEMGFEYDLAKAFADYLGVRLRIKVADAWDEMLQLLQHNAGQVVAASITIIPSRQRVADFSLGYLPVQQMVITHKKNKDIKTVEDLAGQTIHVRAATSYLETLERLNQAGLNITIVSHPNALTEDLIDAVAHREIPITIADSNVALLNRRYYPDIRIAFPVEKKQSLGWAVKKGETDLLQKINEFFRKAKEDGTLQDIYNRYYAYLERFDHLELKKFLQRIKTRLPRYEKTIKKAAATYGFDWRLIAALIYQESQFRPWAKSFSGVRGLMQLTLATAKDMGITNRLDPHQSIMGGTKYLKKLHEVYDGAPEPDRTLIAVAAYNVGKGHVSDARKLAVSMNLDPNRWSSLEKTLPLLRQRKYYKKTKFGYCRGAEPVFQVRRVLTYYDILKRQAIEYTGNKGESVKNVPRGTMTES
ncbi:MAG: membrane-bound lytic murein transglycosylase MltF [Deltaproteobacteria bacterium]|nr:membrane-bound lytic murein transglycosylase MltF [Deltaproteobacteria bacterium]